MRKAQAQSGTPSLAEVVNRAVEVCDPAGTSPAAADFEERFQDRDEPVTAPEDVELELREAGVDPEDEDPVAVMTVAVATYLAYRRTELARDRDHLLRLAARAEFDGEPPEHVARWLAEQGVEP
jgi:hypothetical protein